MPLYYTTKWLHLQWISAAPTIPYIIKSNANLLHTSQNPFYAFYSTTLLRFVGITQPVHTSIPSAKDTPVRTQIIAPQQHTETILDVYTAPIRYNENLLPFSDTTKNIFPVSLLQQLTYTHKNITHIDSSFNPYPHIKKQTEDVFTPRRFCWFSLVLVLQLSFLFCICNRCYGKCLPA